VVCLTDNFDKDKDAGRALDAVVAFCKFSVDERAGFLGTP
jgi:hypothetical protein